MSKVISVKDIDLKQHAPTDRTSEVRIEKLEKEIRKLKKALGKKELNGAEKAATG